MSEEGFVKIFMAFLLAVAAAALSQPAALAFNQRLTIYVSVAEQRGIYTDSSGLITRVSGNTANNVTPMVFNENNQLIAMTDSVQSQYQAFLKAHNYRLDAGETYYLNPVSVSKTADSRTIQINTAGLTLGSGRNG